MRSILYHNQMAYELFMLLLYQQHYASRYRSVAQLITPGASVLDVCCGPAVLYTRYLKNKSVNYTGFDINKKFVSAGRAKGLVMIQGDVAAVVEFPKADFVVMQASLYHFLPDNVLLVVKKMLEAAKLKLIIAEPVRNLSVSRLGWLARLAQRLTDAGLKPCTERFDTASLTEVLARFAAHVESTFPIAGGRELLIILRP